MKRIILTLLFLVTCFSGCAAEKPDAAQTNKKPAPSYFDVRKDIKKYIGVKVEWVAKKVEDSISKNTKTGEQIQSYIYIARDEKGNFFADNPFFFSHAGTYKDTKQTPAAIKAANTPLDPGIRLIKGTVKGTHEVHFNSSGGDKIIVAPELENVTVDMPVVTSGK